MAMAMPLARALGRPEAEIAALRQRNGNVMRSAEDIFSNPQPLGCDAVTDFRHQIELGGRLGEVERFRAMNKKAADPPK
ncbi:MAG: hypothetical protein ABIN96_16250 [Rubrivivax sp.]